MGKLEKLIKNMRHGIEIIGGVKNRNSYFHYDLNNKPDAACPFGCAILGAGISEEYDTNAWTSEVLANAGLNRFRQTEYHTAVSLAQYGVPVEVADLPVSRLSLWDVITRCCDKTDLSLSEIVDIVERLDKADLYQGDGA